LSASIAGGFLTFYYFAIWILTLTIGVLIWDRRRWWRYGLAIGLGIAIASPWLWWGTRQQLRRADFARFAAKGSFWEVTGRHVRDVLNTLGTHLWLGDWASVSPPWLALASGAIAIATLVGSGWILWRHQRHYLLVTSLLLGIFPLAIVLAVDILKGQYTLAFGFGRSIIFILPGCLLLVAAAIVQLRYRMQEAIAIGLLLLYVSINLADAGLRSRQMFHRIAEFLPSTLPEPALVVMDSVAWGHVLRLAYYLPDSTPVRLLAQTAPQLPESLARSLSEMPYASLLWLTFERPLWSPPSTDAEREATQQTLSKDYQRDRQGELRGTWGLDNLQFSQYSQKATNHRTSNPSTLIP
jgi:uncharacterized membrane protein